MAGCRNHPDRDAFVSCQKHQTGLCRECLHSDPSCMDPELYCKFRTQCVINELMKERLRERRRAVEA
ncbi:MAG: hypothetical protein HY788_10755 [Deltaproteobacteria bacterium]|nr:hypothetical protein [Deltaproteobacteria bacterium]